ncbi:MAG TPA: hypothetical protein VFB38_14950 [Chthonomonadaceae bacterium]|jgi:predicted HD phosphohydrolase|nr:hypothetical protein [Chthonomonadaceae bacterium]
MAISLTIYDETLFGATDDGLTLDFLSETITVRELIRERVYEAVRLYNATTPEYFRGLVQPTNAEATLNGHRLRERRRVDWEKQYRLALEAFQRNRFFILVDDRQVESLEDTIRLTPTTQVSFVKLVPLVGG